MKLRGVALFPVFMLVGCIPLPHREFVIERSDLPSPVAATVQTTPTTSQSLDLAQLWTLALEHNPQLREAQAEVEAARGQLVQSGKYPNPRLNYTEDVLGSSFSRQGVITVSMHQEVVTAGKRQLDQAIASRGVDAASLALARQRFELLTRVRKGYYDYQNLLAARLVYDQTVIALEEGLRLTKQLVEIAKTRPQTDLIALQTLLEEAKINQVKTQAAIEAGWRQLAADIAVPDLPRPAKLTDGIGAIPAWKEAEIVTRAQTRNTAVQQARVEADSARLSLERARAEAIPNISIGGGYTLDKIQPTAGGMIAIESALPLWDRKQGRIQEAQARLAKAQAATRSAETRLQGLVAEAFGRYSAARQQSERINAEVLPRLQKRLELLRQAYKAGPAQVSFSDVLLTEQALLATRATLAEARRSLWQAIADLEGLMQLDLAEPLNPFANPK